MIRKWVLSQSEEWTMVFTREKKIMIHPIRIANDFLFHMREKWYVQSEAKEVCEFRAKIPAFSSSLLSPALHTFEEKSFSQRVFLLKKMKNISEMEWNSFVCFTVDKENCKGPAKQPQKSSIYKCKLILKLAWPFYLKSLIFNCTFRTNS